MKHNPTRHCERSEAIQSKWVAASGFMLLIITSMGLVIPSPSFANSKVPTEAKNFRDIVTCCWGDDSYFWRIASADLVFEGHLIRYEIKNDMPLGDRSVNSVIEVYAVDKNWKGTKQGSEVKVLNRAVLLEDQIEMPVMPDVRNTAFLVLGPKISGIVYKLQACPSNVIFHPDDIKEAKEKLAYEWKYWPFWAFFSVKRWVGGLI